MGNRLSKIYTRTGDKGTTGLGDGSRVMKDDLRVEAYGTIDELNSFIGLLLTERLPEFIQPALENIQHRLFDVGSELCMPGYVVITQNHVTELEELLDGLNETLPPLKEFILPGGNSAAAVCHVARSVCRRAERRLVTLSGKEKLRGELVAYINRLSDLLFVIARVLARQAGKKETLWQASQRED